MKEKDESGNLVLAAEMRYFPKLGGMSDKDIKQNKFEGPFRIYRAKAMDVGPTGDYTVVETGGESPTDYSWSSTMGPSTTSSIG
jgi:hypothetical protein